MTATCISISDPRSLGRCVCNLVCELLRCCMLRQSDLQAPGPRCSFVIQPSRNSTVPVKKVTARYEDSPFMRASASIMRIDRERNTQISSFCTQAALKRHTDITPSAESITSRDWNEQSRLMVWPSWEVPSCRPTLFQKRYVSVIIARGAPYAVRRPLIQYPLHNPRVMYHSQSHLHQSW